MTLTWVDKFNNQSVTLQKFITSFRTDINEDVEDVVSDDQILEWVESGLDDISLETGLLPTYCEETMTGLDAYTLPSDIIKINSVRYYDTSSNVTTLVKGNIDVAQKRSLLSSQIPFLYYREGNTIKVYGKPVNGSLRVYGVKRPTAPVELTDFIDLPNEYIKLLRFYCEWKYYKRRRDMDEVTLASRVYYNAIQDAKFLVLKDYSEGLEIY